MTNLESRRSSGRSRLVFALFGVAAAIVCIRLGFWQVGRHAEVRDDRIAREARLATAAVPLAALLDSAAALAEGPGLEWRRVVIAGRWIPGDEVLVRSRTLNGRPGVHVVTPLALDVGTRDAEILVLRGWLPSPDAMTPDTIAAPEPTSIVGRTGVLRLSRDGAGLPVLPAGEGRSRRPTLAAIDVPAIRSAAASREAGLTLTREYFVQLLPRADTERPPGNPIPVPLPGADDGPHLSYAIQWFSFALIAVMGSGAFLYHGRRRGSGT